MKTNSVTTIIERLKIALGIPTDSGLAEYLGISKGALSNWKSRNTVDYALIFSKCEQIDLNWLIIANNEVGEHVNTKEISELSETRPRIPLDAAAGSLSLITQSVSEQECERFPIVERFPQYDFTIMVKGDSMEPEFHSGDEVACRFIEQPTFIQWGRPHVLDTHQGVVLKRIYNRADSILCKSDNKDYGEFEIPKDEILHIALVVGTIRLY